MKYIPKRKYRLSGGFLSRTFNITARNGQVILEGDTFFTKRGRKRGMLSVAVNSQLDSRFKRLVTDDGISFYFVLLNAKNKAIGNSSQLYTSIQAMEKGIASVKHNAI